MTVAAADSQRPIAIEPSLAARLFGLGSIFGKTFRDSRRTAIVVAVALVLIVVVTGASLIFGFETAAKRAALAFQMGQLPAILQGMLGPPIAAERLGGFLSWRVFNFMPVLAGIWSTIALSGILAGELTRGSLDMVAVGSFGRARVALEKVGGYLVAAALMVLLLGLGTYGSIQALAALPGDANGLDAVLAHHAWLYVTMLVPGAIAFAVAPVAGRGAALAAGAVVLFASFVANGYGSIVPAIAAIRPFSYLAFTANHRPMAGLYDWPPVLVLALIVVGLLALGILAFVHRDLLAPSVGQLPMPRMTLWLAGPLSRGVGERLPAALAWGLGLGLYGFVIASSADEFVTQMRNIPEITQLIQRILPDTDILSTGGYLQLALFAQAVIMVGLAAAAFVGGWASDERERRLEMILASPMTRAGWAVRSALSVLVAIAVTTALLALGVFLGAVVAGGEVVRPTVGVAVLGLYGMTLAAIGLAVGGLIRPSLAAPVTLVLGLAFFLLDLIGSVLHLPDWILALALNRHLGMPIVGNFDPAGILACVGITIAGIAICAGGVEKRDIGR
jgi:ABC-2 type transport system permease protein